MNQKINLLTAFVLVAGALAASISGCELVSTVDRSKIPGTGGSTAGTGGTASTSTAGTGGTASTSTAGTGGTASTSTAGTGGTASTSTAGTGGTASTSTAGTGGTASTSSSSSSSSGMMCMTMACTTASTCPTPPNECVTATCAMDCCGTSDVAMGTATVGGQTAGDCMQSQCDGMGNITTVVDTSDAPMPMDACHTGGCTMAGAPTQTPTSAGSACAFGNPAGTVCDGAGNCVGCLVNGNCTAPQVCDTTSHMCVAPTCSDTMQDGAETDVDCGGTGQMLGCAPCADMKHCLVDTDCAHNFCKSGTCTLPTCTDTVQDGNETDVDCGGGSFNGATACPTCADAKKCAANSDCAHGFCNTTVTPHVCQTPTCSDSILDGNETDVDCGGAGYMGAVACPKCAGGKTCNNPSDCASGVCTNNKCIAKANGTACASGAECTSGFCAQGVCCMTACANGVGCAACDLPGTLGTCTNVGPGGTIVGTTTCAVTAKSTCGTTGLCDGAGACAKWSASTQCTADACSNGQATSAANCDGNGHCTAGPPTSCAGGFICQSPSACAGSCTTAADCEANVANPGSVYCNGVCDPVLGGGAVCTSNAACASGACGTSGSGHCCSAACAIVGGTCGATTCNNLGMCNYAASGTSCNGGPSCSNGTLSTPTCNGSGTCTTAMSSCGGYACNGSTACFAACTVNGAGAMGDASCASGNWCNGTACVAAQASNAACGRGSQCSSGVCLGTNVCM